MFYHSYPPVECNLCDSWDIFLFFFFSVLMCLFLHVHRILSGKNTRMGYHSQSACKAGASGDTGLIPGWGKSPGGGMAAHTGTLI